MLWVRCGCDVTHGKRLARKEDRILEFQRTPQSSRFFLVPLSFYFLFCSVADSQSSPSYSPSPVVAQHAWMYLPSRGKQSEGRQRWSILARRSNASKSKEQCASAAYHCLCLRPCRPSLSVISAALIALGRSCLFANTSRMESLNSSSLSMRCSSSRAVNVM